MRLFRFLRSGVGLAAALASALPLSATVAEQDYTSRIVNPSFETDGLSGWTNSGMSLQNNNSPADRGWEKDGTNYVEKWVSSTNGLTAGTVKVSQTVTGLPEGNYIVRAAGHAVNQSGKPEKCSGAWIFGGFRRTSVFDGGEYEVKATVAEGTLTIGFLTEGTDANWVAVDNFRIARTGESDSDYKEYLDNAIEKIASMLDATPLPPRHNKAELENLIAEARKATGKSAILAVLPKLRAEVAVFQSYVQAYARASSQLNIARDFLASSDYPGKETFAKAVADAAKTYESTATTPEQLEQMVDDLKKASADYLAGRPEEWFTVRNGAMWNDRDGNFVQAHGAGFLLVNDTWYMVGEDRSNQWHPDVNLYSSKDLVNWKFEKKIIENKVTHPDLGNSRMIERPKLMYCEKTGKFVVWCHWEAGNYGASEAGVFYCDKVNGDYVYHSGSRPLGVKSRDCNVFIDDDGTAYFISTIEENQHLGLFRLSDDYLEAVEYTELFKNQKREAPAIVKKDGIYYMLSSACSGWDPNTCKLAWSKSLTSGWSSLKSLGNPIAFDTQAASILTVKGTKATTYLYVGDRWQDPSLPESKTIIFPIAFPGEDCTFDYHQQFDINFVTGEWRETPSDPRRLDRSGWKLCGISSEETDKEDGAAANILDGDPSTIWHTRYSGSHGMAPHFITIDMGRPEIISGFLAMPRLDSSNNGMAREYSFETSLDGEKWTMVSASQWLPFASEVYFTPTEARYVRFTSHAGSYGSLSEFHLLTGTGDYAPVEFKHAYTVGSSAWKTGNEIEAETGGTVKFGPDVRNSYGSWAMRTAGGEMMFGRENTLEDLLMMHSGEYTVFFLDMYNRTHVTSFSLNVKEGAGADVIEDTAEVVDTAFYTLSGVRAKNPVPGIYICRRTMSDGRVVTSMTTVK